MPWRTHVVARKVLFLRQVHLVEQPGTRRAIEKRRARANLVIVLLIYFLGRARLVSILWTVEM